MRAIPLEIMDNRHATDGFLSLGVERIKGGRSRKSYVVWEENDVVPILALKIVSVRAGLTDLTVGNTDNTDKPAPTGGEYDTKASIYAKLGVLKLVEPVEEPIKEEDERQFDLARLETAFDGVRALQEIAKEYQITDNTRLTQQSQNTHEIN